MKRPLVLATAYLCVIIVHTWFITYGTWDLLGEEWLSSSFDSLGQRLLQGRADIDPNTIKWEGLKRAGKVYPYFGPFPAFLRVLFDALMPGHFGQWARVSCLVASTLITVAFGCAAQTALSVNSALTERRRTLLLLVVILGFGLGTPVLYLVSCGRIYHEAILWGLCGAMWALFAITTISFRPQQEKRGILVFSCALAVALLSRVTFAMPMCLISPILFLRGARFNSDYLRSLPRRALLFAPAMAALALQLWYNYQRFEALLVFLDYRYFYLDPSKIGGEFNILRVPSSLRNYFAILPDYFSSSLPFFRLVTTKYYQPSLFMQGWQEQTIPLSIASVWLVALAVLGIREVLARRCPRLLFVYGLCLVAESILILAYLFVTQRYTGDLIPLLSLLAILALARFSFSTTRYFLLSLLVVFSAAATIGGTLDWNLMYNGDAPSSYKQRLSRIFHPSVVSFNDDRTRIYLSDLTPAAQDFTFQAAKINLSASGTPLTVFGQRVNKGLGMHSKAKITFAVPSDSEGFESLVALSPDIQGCDKAALQFEVQNDRGDTLFKSAVVRPRSEPEVVDVKLQDTKTISLLVHDGGNGIDCDHANWLWAAFYKKP